MNTGRAADVAREAALSPLAALEKADSELVFGLVSAVGTDQNGFETLFR